MVEAARNMLWWRLLTYTKEPANHVSAIFQNSFIYGSAKRSSAQLAEASVQENNVAPMANKLSAYHRLHIASRFRCASGERISPRSSE